MALAYPVAPAAESGLPAGAVTDAPAMPASTESASGMPRPATADPSVGADALSGGDGVASTDTWRGAAGRKTGREGYQFGDLSRSLIRRGSKSLQRWSTRDNQLSSGNAYEFGDLFLKDIVRAVLVEKGPDSVAPSGREDESESAVHKELAAQLEESRQKTMDLFEMHLPRLEQRLQDFEGYRQVEGQSDTLNLQLIRQELDASRKCQEDIQSICDFQFSASFVRVAEACGELPKIQRKLQEASRIAEECARCADDVCSPGST